MVSWTYSIWCRMPKDLWTYSVPVMARQSTPAKLNRPYAQNAPAWCDGVPQSSWTDPTLRMPQLFCSSPYSTQNLQSAPVLDGTGHTLNSTMPQPSVAAQIVLNAQAEMVSWTYSIRSRIPQDVWTNFLPVMVRQGAPAKLDRPYAQNDQALRQLSILYPKPIECPSSWWNWTYSKFQNTPTFCGWSDYIECPSWNGKLYIFYKVQNPKNVWTNSLPVMVWQGALAKLDRPYAYNATALRQLNIFYSQPLECPSPWWNWTYTNLQNSPAFRGQTDIVDCPSYNGKLDIFYILQNAPGPLDIFCSCHGAAEYPSKTEQTLRLECPNSHVAGHILPITYRVPHS